MRLYLNTATGKILTDPLSGEELSTLKLMRQRITSVEVVVINTDGSVGKIAANAGKVGAVRIMVGEKGKFDQVAFVAVTTSTYSPTLNGKDFRGYLLTVTPDSSALTTALGIDGSDPADDVTSIDCYAVIEVSRDYDAGDPSTATWQNIGGLYPATISANLKAS